MICGIVEEREGWVCKLPTRVTRSLSSRPFAANFCLWTAMESRGEGKSEASDDEETLPSLLPVGTSQLGP